MPHFKNLSQLIKKTLQHKNGIHVYLFRHGQSMANHTGSVVGWTDSKLSIKGRQQSNKMFKSFYPHIQSFSQIHTSDLSRCKQTLKLSLGFSQRKILQTSELRQLNFGDDEGLHYDSLPEQQKKIMSSFQYKAPNGQNWVQVRERALKYLNKLNQGHHLIGTHGGLMCALTYEFGIKQVLPNCSVISAELCPVKKNISKIHFTWSFLEELSI